MKNVACPLCNSEHIFLTEIIDASVIERVFLRSLNIKISFCIKELSYFQCKRCSLGFFDPVVTGDELFYEQLQNSEWYYMSEKPEYHLAKKFLPSFGKILEVGSGKAAFATFVGGDRYVGLEFNDEAIKRARSAGINLIKESIEQHSIGNRDKYSAVVSFQVLEHVANPADFIQGCVDSLHSGGCMVLAVPNHGGIPGIAMNNILDLPPHHVSHWGERTLTHIADQFNLEVVSIESEEVASFHEMWAYRSIFENNMREFLGIRRRLLDVSVLSRVIQRLAALQARFFSPSLEGIKGHTILACYKKL